MKLLDFFTQTLHIPEPEARTHVQTIVGAEEKFRAETVQAIDRKFEERKDVLATKSDVNSLRQEMGALELRLSERIGGLETRMEQNTNRLLIWVVGSIFAAAGLVVTLIKLL